MRFEFKKNLKNLDGRSEFANRVFKMIYQKNNGNLDKSCEEAIPFFNDFEEYVRNFYELVDNDLPLYSYYRLNKYGADSYSITEEEFEEAVNNAKKACNKYYGNK